MNKLFTIKKLISTLILLAALSTVLPIYAGIPNEPHEADAMWVEPSSITYSPANASVGDKFNVTVWLNITIDNVFGYQCIMLYNRTYMRGVRAAFTEGNITSQFMEGHITQANGPIIDTSFAGNGTVLAFESCTGTDYIPANSTHPAFGELIWVEFEILYVPSEGTITSEFDITTKYPAQTWVQNWDLVKLPLTTHNGLYTIIPEFSGFWLLSIFLALTLVFAAFFKKLRIQT